MRYILLLVLFFGSVMAFEIKEENEKIQLDYEYLNGKYIVDNRYIFTDSTDIMVKFINISPELISEFESRYDLELQKVLVVGYYIYKSELGMMEILPQIIEEENIKTVKPNWKKMMRKR